MGRYNCVDGQYNPTAAMLLANNEDSMRVLLSRTSNDNDVGTELIVPFFSTFLVFLGKRILSTVSSFGVKIKELHYFMPQMKILFHHIYLH